jgi:transposase InsO family protein/transposase-like protein
MIMPKGRVYTKEQIAAALQLYGKYKSMPKVIELLGYPALGTLCEWIRSYPELVTPPKQRSCRQASLELKKEAIRRCINGGESLRSVSKDIGYSSVAIWKWIRKYSEEGAVSLMNRTDKNIPVDPNDIRSAEDIEALKAQMIDMQMEIDILKETINVLKKDPGVNQEALSNREKAVIIDALKNKYSLPRLCRRLHISRSSYYYQEKAMRVEDKYRSLRERVAWLFHENYDAFGYRRIQMLLRREGRVISEKVIRRIMKQEGLTVRSPRRRKYSSYKGEIGPAPDNLIDRNFHADKPNQKWLTDITEFTIKAGKVYLSPIIDCMDGMPVSWTLGTSPDAALVNTMLKNAISLLKPDEHPIIHSDRGCHYRWPEWLNIIKESGLTRSMSSKGCSPDNSACEGFFGHLKNEMFYGRNWDKHTTEEFIQAVNAYINWYRTSRIKSTLGGLSPLEYRRRMGVGV